MSGGLVEPGKRKITKIEKWKGWWSMRNPSGFANQCLLKLGSCSRSRDRETGIYLQTLSETSTPFFGSLEFSQTDIFASLGPF